MNRKDRRAAGKRGGGPGHPGDGSLFGLAVQRHQAGQLLEAEMLYRQVLAGDRNHFASLHHLGIIALQRGQPQAAIEPLGRAIAIDGRNPECRYNIGFAFHSLGRLSEAIDQYREAVRLKRDYADAYSNLGNALLQTGALSEGISTYERLIALRPTAETHCNLANVLARSGRLDDAVAQFRRALTLKPDFVAAHNNLANALASLGRPDEALVHFEKALALDPNLIEAHVNAGNVLLALGKQDEAAARFQRALAVNPKFPDAHASLGNVFLTQGRLSEAAQCFQSALDLKPDLPESNNNFGIVLSAQGDFAEAIRRFQLAIAGRPDFIDAYNNLARAFLSTGQMDNALGALRRALAIRETADTQALFAQAVRGLQVPPDIDDFRALFWRALSEPWGRVNGLAPVAAKILKQSAPIGGCIARAVAAWPRRLPAEELFGPGGLAAVADDRILRSLMETATIAGLDFERFLTSARFAMLQIASSADASSLVDPKVLDFACALARQCFINEYVYALTGEEAAATQQLRDKDAGALASGAAIPDLWLAVVATYNALGTLPGADALLDRTWSELLSGVLTQQIREPAIEAKLRAEIRALTPIEDDVSRKVQRQYEENPYPRWTKADPQKKAVPFDRYMRSKFPAATFRDLGKADPDVLIAGCGTGQHAIETAPRFLGARTLAIDLSLTSLAYALRKTRELGVPNIDYAQADILKLGGIGRTFDIIESSGVLHHLGDPLAGWRVLLSLLRPGGFMAVGLYSDIARADIVKARNFIVERGYGSSADEIRRCRQDLITCEDGKAFPDVYTSTDFYSTSDCRDLLFHVQEHRLTIPQIADFLAENALDFVGFELEAGVASQYRAMNPADTAMTDLAAWDAFERQHPGAFSGMYQFWVQKRA
jgi:tetratricopeptide (TPR) repeat protein/SAM-dependent methyltransferase